MPSLTKFDALRLAHRFKALRPDAIDDPHGAGRRLWGDMVNAVTGAGVVADPQLREWRDIAGWQREHDARGPG